ncbi:MAG TPA: hypothetical protein VK530_02000 [Candidatus Acidoferrum sp.]|nr:hypothetical protein [Candidatus Acidoferrum sp.]
MITGAIHSRGSFLASTVVLLIAANFLIAGDAPAPNHGDFVLRDFRFPSGEALPELRIHYVTFGTPQRDEKGTVRNAVLILHGTTGSSAQFLGTNFAGALFGKGQVLDASRYFIVRQVEQAERWIARQVSEVRLSRHGGS